MVIVISIALGLGFVILTVIINVLCFDSPGGSVVNVISIALGLGFVIIAVVITVLYF